MADRLERCDICDIRGGHDVHCVRYPYSRPRVVSIWETAADRLNAEKRRQTIKNRMSALGKRLREETDVR
jgi:hypothetical protein